jgi:hypothetical protein
LACYNFQLFFCRWRWEAIQDTRALENDMSFSNKAAPHKRYIVRGEWCGTGIRQKAWHENRQRKAKRSWFMTERNSAWYKMTRRFEGKTESVLQITSAVGFFPEPRILYTYVLIWYSS